MPESIIATTTTDGTTTIYVERDMGITTAKPALLGEIVRCRDCKMWATELRYMGKCTGKDGKLNPNGYCAWGERRHDGE